MRKEKRREESEGHEWTEVKKPTRRSRTLRDNALGPQTLSSLFHKPRFLVPPGLKPYPEGSQLSIWARTQVQIQLEQQLRHRKLRSQTVVLNNQHA